MKDPAFKINDADPAVAKSVKDAVELTVQKNKNGSYNDACIAPDDTSSLISLKDNQDFAGYYIDNLKDSIYVDISDFNIIERRARFGGLFTGLKRLIWNLLKFYTYRLWSQQNQINGLLLSAVDGIDTKYRDRIKKLEDKVASLEKQK